VVAQPQLVLLDRDSQVELPTALLIILLTEQAAAQVVLETMLLVTRVARVA
jgi:hypothetical protein